MRTQSPALMPRAAAVSGCSSTWGSGAARRSSAIWRCWDSQKRSDLAQVRTSGYSATRSGRDRGLSARLGERGQRPGVRARPGPASRARPARSVCRKPRPSCLRCAVGRSREMPAGLGTQRLEGDAARGELVAPGGIDVAVPEVLAQPEAVGEGEDDLEVRARLAARRDDRATELDVGLRLLADLEPDPQRLGLERARHGQHDVGQVGGRAREDVGVHEEVERCERVPDPRAVPVRHDQVGAEVDEGPCPVGLVLEGGGVEVLAGDELEPGRAQRTVAPRRWPGAAVRSLSRSSAVDGVRRHRR